MLKIKDSVDLKELEKFGFVIIAGHYYKWERKQTVGIRGQSRFIDLVGQGDISLDTLFDLIEAGLVEKVNE